MYGSSGVVRRHDEQLAGHLEVDGQGRLARELDDELLRPPPDRLDPPAGHRLREGVGGVRAQRPRPRAPGTHDRRADDARAQVARDGLDLGELGHARPSLRGERRDRRLERQLVGLGGDRVGARQRRHRFPVVADLDVDDERHRRAAAPPPSSRARSPRAPRPRRAAPRTGARRGPDRSSRARQTRPRSRSATRIIAIFRMSAAVPWIGMLMAIRSPAPRSAGFDARSSGIWRLRPEERLDEALGLGRAP